mmetsp:Transcript_40984/g.112704  ORF Transcript_40984/g.112704 Transcript_40984/m.112704 type:complete len:355 (+) Transcript_40984:1-1065(+)
MAVLALPSRRLFGGCHSLVSRRAGAVFASNPVRTAFAAAEAPGTDRQQPRREFAPEGVAVTNAGADMLAEFVAAGGGKLLCLTGAGCSTESGVPDYRSPQGSYSQGHVPMKHQQFVSDSLQRKRYWARSLGGWRFFDAAAPNSAHKALAALERQRYVSGVVTQNVDGLHQKAGMHNVVDLHGRNDEVACLGCGNRRPRAGFQQELEMLNSAWMAEFLPADRVADVRADGDAELGPADFREFQVPGCKACGGVWKPRVVFFGGSLNAEVRDKAATCVAEASALLVLGSSCQVFSAFRLAKIAAEAGKPIALVNIGETRIDNLVPSHLRLPWRCGEALTAVCARLGCAGDTLAQGR